MPRLPSKYDLNQATPRPNGQIIGGVPPVVQQAGENLGQVVSQFGTEMLQKRQDLAHAKLMNAAGEHELAVAQADATVRQRVEAGEIPYQDAQKSFNESVSQIPAVKVDYADTKTQQTYDLALKQIQAKANIGMQNFVFKREQQDYKGQFNTFLDTQLKLGGLPGANIEDVNSRIDQTGKALAAKAGINAGEAATYIQNAKDQNWYNNANEKIIANRNSINGLKSVEQELSAKDGFYQGRLDTPKRDALLNHAMSMRMQLENKVQLQSDRAEAKAQRAIYEMDVQNASGVPAPLDQMSKWGNTVKGTSFEGDYQERVQDGQKIQEILRKPLDEQESILQTMEAQQAQNGASIREQSNLNRLRGAVHNNVKQLQEAPVLFAANRTGEQVQPLDFNGLLSGDDSLISGLKHRVDTVNALQKQYGTRVQMHPLLPDEAKTLADAFAKMGTTEKEAALHTLNQAVGGAVMVPMMQEVAKNQPLLAVASGLVASQTSKDRSVASLVLQGDELLRGKQIDLPPEPSMNDAFQKYIGGSIQTIPGKQAAYEATKAVYAKLLQESGTYKQGQNQFDMHKFQQAAKLVTGGVLEYNGAHILPPQFGMDESQSRATLRGVTPAQIKSWGGVNGMSDTDAAQFIKNAPLESIGLGKYRVTAGAGILRNQAGDAFVMDFNKQAAP